MTLRRYDHRTADERILRGDIVTPPMMPRYRDIIQPVPREEPEEKTTRIPITFPDELYEWLREFAFRRHEPMAQVVREALREYRERVDPQLPLPLERAGSRRAE